MSDLRPGVRGQRADPAHVRESLRVYAGVHALAAYDRDTRALWAVRVLDAWARLPGLCWKLERESAGYRVTHWSAWDTEHGLLGSGPTPDAARIAAATALVAALVVADPSLDPDGAE